MGASKASYWYTSQEFEAMTKEFIMEQRREIRKSKAAAAAAAANAAARKEYMRTDGDITGSNRVNLLHSFFAKMLSDRKCKLQVKKKEKQKQTKRLVPLTSTILL